MTRPAELESRRLSSSAGRVIVSRSSGAFDASHAGLYHPYHQNLRRRHGQVRGGFLRSGGWAGVWQQKEWQVEP